MVIWRIPAHTLLIDGPRFVGSAHPRRQGFPAGRPNQARQVASQLEVARSKKARQGTRGSRQEASRPASPSRAPGHPGPGHPASQPEARISILHLLIAKERVLPPPVSEHNMFIHWRVEITLFHIICFFTLLDQRMVRIRQHAPKVWRTFV